MKNTLLMDFVVEKESNKIKVARKFDAPLPMVWAAWTEKDILDQWWAPKPWKARTKEMDFSEGGYWLYAMEGPEGEEHWARADFESITPLKGFSALDGFCDERGSINPQMPRSFWTNRFTQNGDATVVNIEITFNSLDDLEKIVEMGFKEGFTAGLENLDHYLSTHQSKENKPSN